MMKYFLFRSYELWKPYLRAMMECDMKAVSIGTKRKTDVLETCLQQMRACFIDVCLYLKNISFQQC